MSDFDQIKSCTITRQEYLEREPFLTRPLTDDPINLRPHARSNYSESGGMWRSSGFSTPSRHPVG